MTLIMTTYQLCLSIFFMLIDTILAADVVCPTVTKTTHHPECPTPTPVFCPQPLCIIESPIQVPCECPNILPTSMMYTACPTICAEGCGTYFSPIMAPCTPTSGPNVLSTITISIPSPTTTLSTITTKPSTCSTITISEGPECWTEGCETTYSRCQTTETVTLKCGCKSIPTVTSCVDKKKCDGGCVSSFQTGYLPCPMTTPFPPASTSV